MSTQPSHTADPRWFALINDRIYPAPRRQIPVALLRAFAAVAADHVLVRDHQSPNDAILLDGATVDLAQGNVFVTKSRSEAAEAPQCAAPAKMALSLDDRFELTPIGELELSTLRSLFGIAEDTQVIRDLESPDDQIIAPGDKVRFIDGPAFLTRGTKPKHIDVSIVTTAGAFPAEEFERLPINQHLKVQLARAVKALKLGDVSDWIARHGTRELDVEKSYADNNLSGKVEIDYGKREGGGGSAQ